MSTWELSGRTALITGAARGIGAATAVRLSARGVNVALVDRDAEGLRALAATLGGNTSIHEVDVTSAGGVAEAVNDAAAHHGGLDIVIANAGIATVGTIADAPFTDLERTIEVNLLGAMRTLRAGLPHVAARRGYLLTVASAAAAGHAPLMGAYAASKAGAEAFTNVLRIEQRPAGVAVGCAYFGWIDTEMVRDSLAHPAGRALHDLLPAPLARTLTADDAARTIEDAVASRAPRAWAPWHVGPSLLLRGVTQPLSELGLAVRPSAVRRLVELARPR